MMACKSSNREVATNAGEARLNEQQHINETLRFYDIRKSNLVTSTGNKRHTTHS
jgi:hypothetical protein